MRVALLTVSLALSCVTVLPAQVDTGTVSGAVTDQTKALIPFARVVVIQLDTNVRSEVVTDKLCQYASPPLRPGRYQLTVTKDGFQGQMSAPFDLRVQDRVEINFQLQLSATSTE